MSPDRSSAIGADRCSAHGPGSSPPSGRPTSHRAGSHQFGCSAGWSQCPGSDDFLRSMTSVKSQTSRGLAQLRAVLGVPPREGHRGAPFAHQPGAVISWSCRTDLATRRRARHHRGDLLAGSPRLLGRPRDHTTVGGTAAPHPSRSTRRRSTVTRTVEERLSQMLHTQADDVRPDVDPWSRFGSAERRHHTTRRIRRCALATAASVVVACVVAAGFTGRIPGWPSHRVSSPAKTSGPSKLWNEPLRSSLAGDSTWIAGLQQTVVSLSRNTGAPWGWLTQRRCECSSPGMSPAGGWRSCG